MALLLFFRNMETKTKHIQNKFIFILRNKLFQLCLHIASRKLFEFFMIIF